MSPAPSRAAPVRGFTLVEMMVSIGIFSIVMLVATSAYYNLIALDRQARATNVVVDNLSFAVDAMTRGMRTGSGYQCVATGGNDTTGNCQCFSYLDSDIGKQVTYNFNTTKHDIERYVASSGSISCTNGTAITDPAVSINTVRFFVRGTGNADDAQPQVLFTIQGSMPSDSAGHSATFTLEEDVSQRLLDL